MRYKWLLLALILVIAVGVYAQDDGGLSPVEMLTIDVINELPHDTNAFTQGLLYHDGLFYESTGRRGQSTVRAVDPETGEVLRRYAVPDEIFAEGLALFNDRLYQITWQAQVAVVYELTTGLEEGTFEPLGLFQYTGDGWGLCADDTYLYMSDGSGRITVRDPETFAPVGTFLVTLHGVFIDEINELECVGDDIYMNIWQSNSILRADKTTGVVNAVIDGSALLTDEQRAALEPGAVLNGIAYDADADTFYITGKLWDTIFQVNFVAAEG